MKRSLYIDTLITLGFGIVASLLLSKALFTSGYLVYNLDISQFAATESLLERSVSQGVPLYFWNPFWGIGMPGMGEPQSMIFYLPFTLLRWLPVEQSLDWGGFFHLWLAGLGVYFLARDFDINRPGAVFSGIAFMLSGAVVSRFTGGHIGFVFGLAWVGWILLCYRRLLESPSRLNFIFTIIFVVFELLAGHTQISIIILLIPVIYFLYYVVGCIHRQHWPELVFALYRSVGVGLFAIGLTAVQLLNTYELYLYSARQSGVPYEVATALSFSVFHLLSIVAPFLWTQLPTPDMLTATPAQVHPLKLPFDQAFYPELSPFVGVLTLIFAVIVVFSKGKRSGVWFFVLLAVVGLVLAMGSWTPVYRVVYAVSSFFRVPGRFILFWIFSMAMLGGFGIDYAMTNIHRIRLRLPITFAFFATAALGTAIWILFSRPALQPFTRDLYILGGTLFAGAALLYFLHAERIPTGYWGWVTVTVLLAEMFVFAWPQIVPMPFTYLSDPSDPKAVLDIDPAQVRLEDGYRISSIYGIGAPELNIALQLQSIQSIKALGLEGGLGTYLLSTGYVALDEPSPKYELLQQADSAYLYQFAENLPRIYAAPAVNAVGDNKLAFDYISGSGFAPFELAIVTDPQSPVPLPVRASQPLEWNAEITEYNMASLTAEVTVNEPALVVFGEAYFPGWEASVDGIPTEVLQANYAFRGVAVEAGTHTIQMQYEPTYFRIGLYISIGTLVTLIVTTVWYAFRKRRITNSLSQSTSEHTEMSDVG